MIAGRNLWPYSCVSICGSGSPGRPAGFAALADPGEGQSHFPYFAAESFEFQDADPNLNPTPFSTPAGSYAHEFVLTDTQGNGSRITAPFTVVPEPGTTSLALLSVAVTFLWRRR